jgi:hypothetical protein
LPAQISGSSPPAAQLLQTIFRPEVLQALMAMVLGQAGRPNIPVGATQVPVGAFANLVRELADRAAAEYNAGAATPREDIPAYLQDFLGEARHDPATPSGRAARLFEVLQETDLERAAETPEGTLRSAARDVTVEIEIEAQYYDELELAELYADGVLP